jgi:hypothetical protein
MPVKMDISITGPLFEQDPRIRPWEGMMVQRLIEKGEDNLDGLLRPRPAGVYLSVEQAGRGKASTGHYRRNVVGKQRGLVGIITDSGVVYGPWLEGTGSRNKTTRFKGYKSFRRTKQYLLKNMQKLLKPVISAMYRDLGG